MTSPGPPPAPQVDEFVPRAHPGARLPHAWLDDWQSLFDALGREFSILTFGPSCADFAREAERLGVDLAVVNLTARPLLRGRYGADLLLVRPDQHVAWRGDGASPAHEALARATGR